MLASHLLRCCGLIEEAIKLKIIYFFSMKLYMVKQFGSNIHANWLIYIYIYIYIYIHLYIYIYIYIYMQVGP